MVYRFALRIIADNATAEDVVSVVFCDVWRKAGAFEGRSKVSTWLVAITRHKALEIARRRTPEALDDDTYEAIADEADDPAITTQKKQRSAILLRCLDNLSPAHREVIDLVYYHDKSFGEIAAIIRVPRNTVKTRMSASIVLLLGDGQPMVVDAGGDGRAQGRSLLLVFDAGPSEPMAAARLACGLPDVSYPIPRAREPAGGHGTPAAPGLSSRTAVVMKRGCDFSHFPALLSGRMLTVC